jgi:hypothetical protein
MSNNMDKFNIAVIELFHACLDDFPIPTKISSEMLTYKINEYFSEPESKFHEAAQYSFNEQVCSNTITWLVSEKFITIVEKDELLFSLTLTQKGLNAVNSVPSSLEGKSESYKDIFLKGAINLPIATATNLITEFFK